MSALEVHHIFPKAFLYKHEYRRPEVNAVANFCFLTKDTNLQIGARPPEEYFPEIEQDHPGALASQWIPMDPQLWKVENYRGFLEERRRLLAAAANGLLAELLHEEAPAVTEPEPTVVEITTGAPAVVGGVESKEEEQALLDLNRWIVEQGLPEGSYLYELADVDTGEPVAILDLAWPNGLQEGYSQPVAVLLNEGEETLDAANAHGFRYFDTVETFQAHVRQEVLAEEVIGVT